MQIKRRRRLILKRDRRMGWWWLILESNQRIMLWMKWLILYWHRRGMLRLVLLWR